MEDCQCMLEDEIQKAFKKGGHVLATSFDMEAVYDRAWKKSALLTLMKNGVRGNMLRFIRNFLDDRRFRVLVRNHASTPRAQGPQGSVLSATIFLLIMNGIRNCVIPPVKSFTFAGDKTIYISGKDLAALELEIQITVDQIVEWAESNEFRFLTEKTKLIHFNQLSSCMA